VSSRIRTLQTELAEANSERSLLADKLSALEAASDLERNAAYVLRKELKALRKERKLSMHDVLAHLPSSRQPFHQMLLAAQRSSIPVLMADVQHIMEGVSDLVCIVYGCYGVNRNLSPTDEVTRILDSTRRGYTLTRSP
jgi:hypothetical protein